MDLEEYKKKVLEDLVKMVGQSRAQRLMTAYSVDFPMFLKEKWTPEFAAFAMMHGY